MNYYINTINKKPKGEYLIYSSGNILIKFITSRFLNKISFLLNSINAYSLFGIDVGVGEGHMLYYLYKNKIINKIVGIDLDEERINFAKKHYPVCNYKVMDIYNLRHKNQRFDYIIATEILEHLPDPESALVNIQEVANANAYIIISVPFEPYFQIGNFLRGKYWKRLGKTPTHLNFWTKKTFLKLLESYINIEIVCSFSTFPWILVLGRIKSPSNRSNK